MKKTLAVFTMAGSILSLTLSLTMIGGCTSAQEKAKERQKKLLALSTAVVKHMLDRDPATIQQSLDLLSSGEMNRPTFEKLQAQQVLPETSIDVLKIIQNNKKEGRSNQVTINECTPLGPLDTPKIPFRVTGVNTTTVGGKTTQKAFSYTLTCMIPPEAPDFPAVIDVQNDDPSAVQASGQTKSAQSAAPKSRKRKRR